MHDFLILFLASSPLQQDFMACKLMFIRTAKTSTEIEYIHLSI